MPLLTVNGKTENYAEVQTLADLVSQLKLPPEQIATEVNKELISKKHYAAKELKDGDQLEIVTLIGGG